MAAAWRLPMLSQPPSLLPGADQALLKAPQGWPPSLQAVTSQELRGGGWWAQYSPGRCILEAPISQAPGELAPSP